MADSTTPATEFHAASLKPSGSFNLDELRNVRLDGQRDDRLRFFVPQALWLAIDGLRLDAGKGTTIGDIVVYGHRRGRSWISQRADLPAIEDTYRELLLLWKRFDLLQMLPKWSYSLPDSHRNVDVRKIRPEDGAWAAGWANPFTLTQMDINQALFVAGVMDGPIGPAYQEALAIHMRVFVLHLNLRRDILQTYLQVAQTQGLSSSSYPPPNGPMGHSSAVGKG